MRIILTILAIYALLGGLTAQSNITSISISPLNPNENDTIYIYAELQFPSGECELDNKNHTVILNTIMASSLHCLGPLAVICHKTDTFMIPPLTPGNYSFILELSTGMAPAPCSPGITIDDADTLNFTVSSASNIEDLSTTYNKLYPNPVTNQVSFIHPTKHTLYLYDPKGNLILEIEKGSNSADLTILKPGIYILKDQDKHTRIIKL